MMRVRFAPSPTGNLHVGGLRTALFNYIITKKSGGKFILRIEDTDILRSKPEYEESIINSLKWIGINWDEFYRQSDRTDRYDLYFDRLISEKKAYYCFCKGEESCNCKNLKNTEIAKKIAQNESYTIKLKTVDKDYIVTDKIKGEIIFKGSNYKDFIIRKSDGMPVFHFAVVIDDYEMGINFVLRGEDHLSNTPIHMMIYDALGFEIPEYAHLPLLFGEDKTKLSKSHGDISIEDFRKNGFIKEAVINYLLSLGVSWNFETEFYDMDKCIENIYIEKIIGKPSVFSFSKLKWYNKKYMAEKTTEEISLIFKNYINQYRENEEFIIPNNFEEIVKISKDKVSTLAELFDLNKFFFNETVHYNVNSLSLLKEYVKDIEGLTKRLDNCQWDVENIMDCVRDFAKERGKILKEMALPLRYIITGQEVSAGIFEIMYLIGKNETMERLKSFLVINHK